MKARTVVAAALLITLGAAAPARAAEDTAPELHSIELSRETITVRGLEVIYRYQHRIFAPAQQNRTAGFSPVFTIRGIW